MLLKNASLLLFFLTLIPTLLFGQGKIHRDAMVWPELQADYVMHSQSYFFFRNQYRLHTSSDFDRLERMQFQLGYEHMFNENWSGGLSERLAFEDDRKLFFSEVFLRQRGHIGSVRFTKWADFEYIINSGADATSRFRFRADLDRRFEVSESLGIRPRLSYELLFLSGLTGENPANQRRVDRTRLRLDTSFEIADHVIITPYFTKQTNYIETLPQYDQNGEIKIQGGNQNVILPIIGLELRVMLFKGEHHEHRTRSLLN
jgi:hypothetical protein